MPADASSAMVLAQTLYRTLVRGVRAVSPLLSAGSSKLSRGLRGRRRAHGELIDWGRTKRDADRPVVWLHASSVGEALQARVVLDALRERRPEVQAVFTFFSPSAEALVDDFPADVASYLPWDLPEVVGQVLDALRPDVVVFTQKEVWPTLTAEAERRGVPTVLMAATLPEKANRLRWSARAWLGTTFRSLKVVAAISEEDGARFGLLTVPRDRIVVTGDPGVDSAVGRAAGADPHVGYLSPFQDGTGPILVAGSTWKSDEDVLIPALARVRETRPGLRLVLAPHEPARWDFDGLWDRLAADGWSPALLEDVERSGTLDGVDAVLVERVGVLAHLYTVAAASYVGGGFHDRGLHSVLEPAAAGVPVLFGPQHGNSLAASHLLASGGAREVSDVDSLAAALEDWLGDPETLRARGQEALAYIEAHRGAADRTAELLADFIVKDTRGV